jgi:hypothetical protein
LKNIVISHCAFFIFLTTGNVILYSLSNIIATRLLLTARNVEGNVDIYIYIYEVQ